VKKMQEKLFEVEKILEFNATPFTTIFNEMLAKYSTDNIRFNDDEILLIKIPNEIREQITGHLMNLLIRCNKSENNLKECERLIEEYDNNQSYNPTLIYNENIYDLICWQIRSSREAKEIASLLIDENISKPEMLKKWCKGKYNNSDDLCDAFNWSYEIRGEIDHPNNNIYTTMLKKTDKGIEKPISKFSKVSEDIFELGKTILNINFAYQKMCIELGFYYSKYVTYCSKGNTLYTKI
jgi:hypothetical protein